MVTRERILIVLSLITGCLYMGMVGTINAFTTYFFAVKKTFNYTQSQTELIAAFISLGFCTAFPPGFVWERFGGRITSLVATVMTVIPYLLIFSTTFDKTYYSGGRGAALQTFYFFLYGFGTSFLYMTALLTCILNFSATHRGKVVSILDASSSAGSTLLALFYGLIFVQGHITDEQNQDLRDFYLSLTVSFFVVGVLGVIFMGSYKEPEVVTISASSSSTALVSDDSGEEKYKYGVIDDTSDVIKDKKDVTGWKLLLRLDFHLQAWSFVIMVATDFTLLSNITTFLKSAHLETYNTSVTTTFFVLGLVIKPVYGALSDATVHRMSRVIYLLVPTALQTAIQVALAITTNHIAVQITAVVILALSNSATWCLSSVLFVDTFGTDNFGHTWGAIILVAGVASVLMQQLFGALYDSAIDVPGETDCYGDQCYRLIMIILATLGLAASVLYALLRRRKEMRCTRKRARCREGPGATTETSRLPAGDQKQKKKKICDR